MKNNNIMIKSFPNGIAIHLNPDIDFQQLLDEIALKFQQGKNFFKNAKIALSLEGRILTSSEERQIINTIQRNSDLEIICIVGKKEETNKKFVKAIQTVELQHVDNIGRFYRGNLKKSQRIETESSIVILGDVEDGSVVTADKDIIVIGKLLGEAYAGGGGEESNYIIALEMSPKKLKIGDFRYRKKEKSKWGFKLKEKVQPKIAYVKNSQVVIEPITKELLEFLP